MAAKKDDFARQQSLLNKELKEGTFHRVYLVCGDQAYLRLQNRDRLRAALLGDGDEMNVSSYSGMDVTAREVIDQAETLPFFADRRVILLENSVFFSKKASVESDALAAYIPEIPESAALVFVEEAPDKRKKLYKAIQKNGFVLSCEDLTPQMLGRWTAGLFQKAGLAIDGPTLNRFLETVGEDMMNIVSESEKLIGYCMGRESVTAEDITFDTPLLVEHLAALRAGHAVECPVYDYTVHNRSDRTLTVRPAKVIVVEGILIFAEPELCRQMDIKIFVDTDADVRILRRIVRDTRDRGRDLESIVTQYLTTVKPMHEMFVEPSKRNADIIIPEGGHNQVAVDFVVERIRAHVEGRI